VQKGNGIHKMCVTAENTERTGINKGRKRKGGVSYKRSVRCGKERLNK
jgi:hypothetical protein